eukprot:scaffold3130_cov95-Pinguiococcus_pyrenoidosus.AAC.1
MLGAALCSPLRLMLSLTEGPETPPAQLYIPGAAVVRRSGALQRSPIASRPAVTRRGCHMRVQGGERGAELCGGERAGV